MTIGRLIMAIVMTLNIILGSRHEERSLLADLGEVYEEYRETTPMLLPKIFY